MIDEDLVERLAQAVHERYLSAQRRRGTDGTGTVSWAELGADMQEANRAQARYIEAKLRGIGCVITVDDADEPAFAFSESEVEQLARDEHERWYDQRIASGWSFGPQRNEATKHHPSLVPWNRLSEAERDKDRDAVRAIPAVLTAVGLMPRRQ